ncbi:hypothetical protein [Amphritea sp.]|uniref:AbiU2 domain-containing protein n=1 Tax=Amphritea sp. TaxID=1872502 RepID=UPI0025C24910|nr:hypothetical protein [Amphritea sp.]
MISDRIDKLIFINEGVISDYFIVDQNWQILAPLLKDENIYSRWDHSYGVDGVNVIRIALYTRIISELHSILFDNDKKSGSIKNVIVGLQDKGVIKELRKRFCSPSGVNVVGEYSESETQRIIENIQLEDIKRKEEAFDRILPEVITSYENLETSELAVRIKTARDKIYAHKEIRTIDGERKYYDASDLGLQYDDAEQLIGEAKKLIFNANILLTNSSYSLDSFLNHHKKVANEYWAR